MTRKLLLFAFIATSAALSIPHSAQSQQQQQELIVPAANMASAGTATASAATSSQSTATSAANVASIDIAVRLLEKLKAANADILKRQQVTLQRLDEVQQAADELKIFAKRG